ncbi:MAG: hypothetical protein ACYCPW_01600 [Nitrososphaerales archaeon]
MSVQFLKPILLRLSVAQNAGYKKCVAYAKTLSISLKRSSSRNNVLSTGTFTLNHVRVSVIELQFGSAPEKTSKISKAMFLDRPAPNR